MDTMEIDDDVCSSRNLTMEGLITKVDLQRKQPSKCLTVCLGLLCAALLAGNIGQIIHYEIISRQRNPTQASFIIQGDQLQSSYEALAAEREQLEARLTNLTTEKDQLQQSYNSLITDRDQFNASFSNVKTEKDRLQTIYDTLKRESDQLMTSYNDIQRNLEGLQTNHNNLRNSRDQLQTRYSTLQREKDELQKIIDKVKRRACQTGWQKFDIGCYFASTSKKNWTSSRQECIDMGADLVVIDSQDEQQFVNGMLTSGQNAWIGLTDSLTEGTWMWVDGTPVTTTYWQPGQPNSFNGNQDCGEILFRSAGVGEWNDDGCFSEQNWICEN